MNNSELISAVTELLSAINDNLEPCVQFEIDTTGSFVRHISIASEIEAVESHIKALQEPSKEEYSKSDLLTDVYDMATDINIKLNHNIPEEDRYEPVYDATLKVIEQSETLSGTLHKLMFPECDDTDERSVSEKDIIGDTIADAIHDSRSIVWEKRDRILNFLTACKIQSRSDFLAFIKFLVDHGIAYHPDDDPADILSDGLPLFGESECEQLRRIVEEGIQAIYPECPCALYEELREKSEYHFNIAVGSIYVFNLKILQNRK